jgi:solute carrier family 36 (proton-coupled amino acid transporter)
LWAQEEKKSSHLKALSNIFISFVGAGVLGLPHAFQRSGLVQGPLVMVMVAGLALHCMLLLVQCKRCGCGIAETNGI